MGYNQTGVWVYKCSLNTCWCCGPEKDVAEGGNWVGKRRLGMERSSGTQVIHWDLAAMGNLSGCVLQTFTYVWGGGMGHGTYTKTAWSFQKIQKWSNKLIFNIEYAVYITISNINLIYNIQSLPFLLRGAPKQIHVRSNVQVYKLVLNPVLFHLD